MYNGGTKEATKLCYTGYFTITLYANYGLWFGICLTLIFFIITLSLDSKPIDLTVPFHESAWTHHPLYSVSYTGNEIYTRKTRASLIFFTILNLFVWNSYFFRHAYSKGNVQGWMCLAFALQTIPIGWGISYIIGYWLRRYYICKSIFMKTNDDKDDTNAQFNIFIFYLLIFIAFWVCNAFTVWNMDNVNSVNDTITSNYWVASIFIGLAFEYFLFDPFVCFIATKSESVYRWIKWKGMVYDQLCHDTFLESLKKD